MNVMAATLEQNISVLSDILSYIKGISSDAPIPSNLLTNDSATSASPSTPPVPTLTTIQEKIAASSSFRPTLRDDPPSSPPVSSRTTATPWTNPAVRLYPDMSALLKTATAELQCENDTTMYQALQSASSDPNVLPPYKALDNFVSRLDQKVPHWTKLAPSLSSLSDEVASDSALPHNQPSPTPAPRTHPVSSQTNRGTM